MISDACERETMTPEPLLLPGQAAAPDGPADMTMMYVLHHAFRRDVRDFARATEATAAADLGRWSLLVQRWDLFAHELHQHHTKEDEILWPLLLERARAADDVESERVLREMEAEHAALDPLLGGARDAMNDLSAGAAEATRKRLRGTLGRLGQALDQHLGHEESAAVAILQRYVGGDEWSELERTRFRPKQSLGQAKFFVPWALKGLPPGADHRVLNLGGPPLRVINAISRRGFRAQEQEYFGFVE